ncbi:MAG: cupin domain-containing protein [Desulfobacteraceae bacterium]|nr:cupin domain-containing protein [Desulfobacteraceae bacterium]
MKNLICGFCLFLILSTYAWAQDAAQVKVDVLAKSSDSWNGKALPGYPDSKPEITILRILIPPKTRLPEHMHPVINAGVLIKGQLTVVTDKNKILRLKAGDPIIEVVDTWHYGENNGDETADIIVFYAGVKGEPITVKKSVQK